MGSPVACESAGSIVGGENIIRAQAARSSELKNALFLFRQPGRMHANGESRVDNCYSPERR